MLLSPQIRFGGKSKLFAKIAVSKCLNRLGLVREGGECPVDFQTDDCKVRIQSAL